MSKINTLLSDWGINTNNETEVDNFMRDCIFDSLNPGICKNNGCDYSTEVEPDQGAGYCEICETTSVVSASLLLGII